MKLLKNYFTQAEKYESIYRALLKDLEDNRLQRPLGGIIPENLHISESLEKLFETFSSGNRNGKFTILDFQVNGEKAIIAYECIDRESMGGNGVEIIYKISEGSKAVYEIDLMDWKLNL